LREAQEAAITAAGGVGVRLIEARADFQGASYVWRYSFFSANRLMSGDLITVEVDRQGKAIVVEKLSTLKWKVREGIDLNSLKVSLPEALQAAGRGGLVFSSVSIDRDYAGRVVYRFVGAGPDYKEVLVDADAGIIASRFDASRARLNPFGFSKDVPFDHRAILREAIRERGEELRVFLSELGFRPEEMRALEFVVISSQKASRPGSGASSALSYSVNIYSAELSHGGPVHRFTAVVDAKTKALAFEPAGKKLRR
jgi:hypothetical protein